MKLAAPHIGNLFNYASYKGINEGALREYLINSNLDVCNIENSIDDSEFIKVFEFIIKNDSTSHTGLNYGCYLNIKALGFISQVTLNAVNIEQAVFILQQYFDSLFPLVALKVEKSKTHYKFILESKIKNTHTAKHLLDAVFCFVYRELKLMIPEAFKPLLQMPGKDIEQKSLMIGTKVSKGNKHCIIFGVEILSVEINANRTKQIELLLPQFLRMLQRKKRDYKPFSYQVRNMILSMCAPELPSLKQVVVQFPLSNRSFQRKLSEEGLTFRQISDDIKRELTSYLIRGNKMKTQDIAYILGYSESSAFLHAAKKWNLY